MPRLDPLFEGIVRVRPHPHDAPGYAMLLNDLEETRSVAIAMPREALLQVFGMPQVMLSMIVGPVEVNQVRDTHVTGRAAAPLPPRA